MILELSPIEAKRLSWILRDSLDRVETEISRLTPGRADALWLDLQEERDIYRRILARLEGVVR